MDLRSVDYFNLCLFLMRRMYFILRSLRAPLDDTAPAALKLPRRSFLAQFTVVALGSPVAAKAMSPFLSNYVKGDLDNELISAQQVRQKGGNTNK